MKRIVSVWLPAWPIERLKRAEPKSVPCDEPLALVVNGTRGLRITALNACARREGVRVGQTLSDARATLPALLSRVAEPAHDKAALLKLAHWCGRYGPQRNYDGSDGLWVDVTGVAHLFGGERALLEDLRLRLLQFGLTACLGLADTFGAAHALARFASGPQQPFAIAPEGATQQAIEALPIEALRLSGEAALTCRRLGLKLIGQLCGIQRSALARRFRSREKTGAVLMRLDEALGEHAEPLVSLNEPAAFEVRKPFTEPLISAEIFEAEAARLIEALCERLCEASVGARRLVLTVYRCEGTVAEIEAGTSRACRDSNHLKRLFGEKAAHIDAGFGIDGLVVSAIKVEPWRTEQEALCVKRDGIMATGDAGQLIDRITNRLGRHSVIRLSGAASHIPERAQRRVSVMDEMRDDKCRDVTAFRTRALPRPLLLLNPPEPIDVMAEIPEGAPARFTWRRIKARIARAQGPERIAREWWCEIGAKQSTTRDYYLIETLEGALYWVFRAGLYGREDDEENSRTGDVPRWFMHGVYG